MPARALTAEQVAAEFGRSRAWIYENWQRLVAEKRLPPPLQEAGHLVWSAAQVYAYLDKDLPPKLRALTAAHRAAMDAAASAPADRITGESIEHARSALDARFSRAGHPPASDAHLAVGPERAQSTVSARGNPGPAAKRAHGRADARTNQERNIL